MRLVSARSRVRSSLEAHLPVRYGVVGNISACHADARGSIPRFGVLLFFLFRMEKKDSALWNEFGIFFDETLSTLCPSG